MGTQWADKGDQECVAISAGCLGRITSTSSQCQGLMTGVKGMKLEVWEDQKVAWGPDATPDPRTMDPFIQELNSLLEDGGTANREHLNQ